MKVNIYEINIKFKYIPVKDFVFRFLNNEMSSTSTSIAKILAGAGMMVPAYVLHTYVIKTTENRSTKESALETAKLWVTLAVGAGVITLGFIGVLHVLSGASDLSPKLCPRE